MLFAWQHQHCQQHAKQSRASRQSDGFLQKCCPNTTLLRTALLTHVSQAMETDSSRKPRCKGRMALNRRRVCCRRTWTDCRSLCRSLCRDPRDTGTDEDVSVSAQRTAALSTRETWSRSAKRVKQCNLSDTALATQVAPDSVTGKSASMMACFNIFNNLTTSN